MWAGCIAQKGQNDTHVNHFLLLFPLYPPDLYD